MYAAPSGGWRARARDRSSVGCRSRRGHSWLRAVMKEFLQRSHPALGGFEEALEMLPRVDEPLGAHDAVGAEQHRIRQLPDLVRDPERGRERIRKIGEPLGGDEALVLAARAVAREHDVEPGALVACRRAQ